MAERTDELRADIEQRRQRIGSTVDQIENRVRPGRVAARGRYRIRRRVVDWRDRIMGNDEPNYPGDARYGYPQAGYPAHEAAASASGLTGEGTGQGGDVRQRLSEAGDRMEQAPEMVRRRTRGNPLAAGLVAMGAGLLVGSLFPGTGAERQAARRIQPAVGQAVSEAAEKGRDMAEEVKDSARQSTERVKREATEASAEAKEQAQESVRRTREDTGY